ncbi:hypothetical protein Dda_5925 [Drechslerella dactyloides]|uniref:Uncharacterized protein n=1 Tax=Drechslerella dactyloides TaxID=74499 RepID=A0AAD6NI02_DREDA|nr:hypothetical protein Dda_5925 [Drechslerella dactyloides]
MPPGVISAQLWIRLIVPSEFTTRGPRWSSLTASLPTSTFVAGGSDSTGWGAGNGRGFLSASDSSSFGFDAESLSSGMTCGGGNRGTADMLNGIARLDDSGITSQPSTDSAPKHPRSARTKLFPDSTAPIHSYVRVLGLYEAVLKLFVKDSPLSRKDHEASPRHQHALQRFLRDLHKNKEREAVAAENTKREAERLNNLDNPDYVAKPLARRAADLVTKPAKASTFRSEEQQKKHLDELAALGVAMPESYRKEHALVGEWETVRVIERPATPEDGAGSDDESDEKRIKRRKLGDAGEGEEDDEEAEARNFTVRTMEYPGDTNVSRGIGDITFKKKGKSKQVMRTMEYPNQPSASDLGDIVFKKKGGAKAEPKEEEPIDRQAGESLKRSDNEEPSDQNPTPAESDENPVSKHESDEEGKPTTVESVEEGTGVAFKARKSRNTNRRRI